MVGSSGRGFSGSRGLKPGRSLYRADRLALCTGDLYTAKLTKIAERTQSSTRLRVKRVASKKARAAWGSQFFFLVRNYRGIALAGFRGSHEL